MTQRDIILALAWIVSLILTYVIGRLRFQQEIRFAKSHEKRLRVIEVLYKRLRDVYTEYSLVASEAESPDAERINTRLQAADTAQRLFTSYLLANRIFIEESLCIQAFDFIAKVNKVFIRTVSLKGYAPKYYDENDRQWREKYERALETLYPLLEEVGTYFTAIETTFREILGIECRCWRLLRQFAQKCRLPWWRLKAPE